MKSLTAFASSVFLSVALTVSAAPSFTPVPLAEGANTAFADAKPDDRQGGWLDLGGNDLSVIKPGRLDVSGIPFDVLGDAATDGKSCIVLGGPQRAYLTSHAEIPVDGKQGNSLYLLHAAAWCPPANAGRMTGTMFVDYVGGEISEYHVRFGRDVGDWAKSDAHKNAARVWTAYNSNTQVSLFASRFELKDLPVKSIRLVACESAWMVVAATIGDEAKIKGIKPDLTLDKTYIAPALFTEPLAASAEGSVPKNVILLIGDGMGPGAVKLASLYQHKAEGKLVMEQLPVQTFCNTLSMGSNITDSAAASTALSTGQKTLNSRLGLAHDDTTLLISVAEAARKQGRAVGIITSDAITGATPAGNFAHVPARNMTAEIAAFAAGSGYDILIGNANDKAWFTGKGSGGKRPDDRDLIAELTGADYTHIDSQAAFDQAPRDKRVFGFMPKGTLDSETCLADLTVTAIDRLSKNDKGFFMMVECTITDYGGHNNNPELSVRGTLQVDWMVKAAVEIARKRGDTLVMVTADHDTGGLTSSITNDPPGKLVMDYASTGHTAIPVRFFAYGPGSQRFNRPMLDNTDIANTVFELWSLNR